MQQIAQTMIFDNLKEKLSNPILYTFFFVFLSCNYHNFLFLIYEPLKMSFKLLQLENKWLIWEPIWKTFALIIVVTILNSVYEYYKQVCHKLLQSCLNKTKIKEFVSVEVYEALRDKYEGDKASLSSAIDKADMLVLKSLENEKKVLDLEEKLRLSYERVGTTNSTERVGSSIPFENISIDLSVLKNCYIEGHIVDKLDIRDIERNVADEGLWLLKYVDRIFDGKVDVLQSDSGIELFGGDKHITFEGSNRIYANLTSSIDYFVAHKYFEKRDDNNTPYRSNLRMTSSGYILSDAITYDGFDDTANNETFALAG